MVTINLKGMQSIGKCFWDELMSKWVSIDTHPEITETFTDTVMEGAGAKSKNVEGSRMLGQGACI